ncbi:MAG: hypothetical protein AAF384_09195 [Pseudomonadota bacterium]
MNSFEIRKNKSKKTSGLNNTETNARAPRRLRAIVKVNVEDYVPVAVNVRSRIDSAMFTADFSSTDLEMLERDENVVSIAVSQSLDIID